MTINKRVLKVIYSRLSITRTRTGKSEIVRVIEVRVIESLLYKQNKQKVTTENGEYMF